MYERYTPSDRVFVDREEHLNWMMNALTRCQDKSIVLHLRGIGGIGKTALLNHWQNSVEASILLDCERITELYSRFDTLAKGAVQQGISLRRFDLLWSIRLRFVQGIEPAKEPGRSWAFDVIKPLPFIGSMVHIGKAIHTVGSKLKPRLQRRFGDVADWLQTRLGKNYTEELLGILWKDPRRAEMLFLDALQEDLNNRKDTQQPILLLFDHYEEVDSERLKWRYNGRKISEAELWYEFLASLSNSVGVTASRKGLPKRLSSEVAIEEIEVTELDADSCCNLLTQHDVTDQELQAQIVSVSGGNPFVINTICDMEEFGELTLEDITTLRADTLEEVRLKTWRRLFNKAEGLMEIVDYAGILPFFNRKIMDIIFPKMKTDHWERLTHLSFVQELGDGSWKLHDLAQDLVLAELEDKLAKFASDVSERLEQAGDDQADVTLQGMALSVLALVDEPTIIDKAGELFTDLNWEGHYQDALSFLAAIRFHSEEGRVMLQWHRARIFFNLYRFVEAEQDFREVLSYFRTQVENAPDKYSLFLAWTLTGLAVIFGRTGRISNAETTFQEAIQIFSELAQQGGRPMFRLPDIHLERLIWTTLNFAQFLESFGQFSKAEIKFEKALELIQKSTQMETKYKAKGEVSPRYRKLIDGHTGEIEASLAFAYINSSKPFEAEELIRDAYRITSIPKDNKRIDLFSSFYPNIYRIFAYVLMRTGRPYEAEPLIRKVIENLRGLLHESPRSLPQLAHSLNVLGIVLRHQGNLPEAEDVFQESLEIYRKIAKKEPVFNRNVALVLNNLAFLHRQKKQFKEAEAAHRESLQINRDLVGQVPEHNFLRVSRSLTNFAVLLRETDRLDEAEDALREALEIRRKLADREPNYYRQHVATSLNNLGPVMAVSKHLVEAETVLGEALQLRRELAEQAPTLYLSELASTLNNLGILFKQTERFSEAEQAYRESLSIFEKLASKVPKMYQSQVVKVLKNLMILRFEFENPDLSLEEIQHKLQKLNVIKPSEVEEWCEDEEDSYLR
ncbi:MAG: tetratricopeptide repeat protein [Candidatus Hermodarchaeia archaeon]|jgi:tetratricopeptide (TPR) repeat protein